jgi:hypothetical protein
MTEARHGRLEYRIPIANKQEKYGRMKRTIVIAALLLTSSLSSSKQAPVAGLSSEALGNVTPVISTEEMPGAQDTPSAQCPVVIPDSAVVVAPNQPEAQPRSTVGIINALCDVTLDFVQCGFTPTTIVITCDTNGDGVPELMIPLKNVKAINNLLVQGTLPALSPQLPGSPFPLACCGGEASLILSRHVTAGDDNIFGPFTQTQTCQIDLGVRAPVVISASPAEGDCSRAQNLLLPGSCYLLADGKPNVTSVFAVDRANPANVIQSTQFVILNSNLIDAHFDFGPASAGKTFLIFASGPNGTSRNLTSLPPGAPAGCPLGNEQGVTVSFTCRSQQGPGSGTGENPPPPPFVLITSCRLERDPSGVFSLNITGTKFRQGGTLRIGNSTPKKLKYKDFDSDDNAFHRIVAKGRLCKLLPGVIVYTGQGLEPSSLPFFCGERCD